MKFDETKHPRDGDGKFTDGSSTSERDKRVAAIRKYSDEPSKDMQDLPSPRGKNKSCEDFFGEEFKGVKGKDAVEKLLKEKRGHVKNAFERPEIGEIDLVWGDENGGLQHTIERRDKMLARGAGTISGLDMVRKIPNIVEKGEFNIDDHDRPGFNYAGCRVAIRPSYDGRKLNWVVSAMEILQ